MASAKEKKEWKRHEMCNPNSSQSGSIQNGSMNKKMSSQEVTSVSWSHWNVRECEAELLQKTFNVTGKVKSLWRHCGRGYHWVTIQSRFMFISSFSCRNVYKNVLLAFVFISLIISFNLDFFFFFTFLLKNFILNIKYTAICNTVKHF